MSRITISDQVFETEGATRTRSAIQPDSALISPGREEDTKRAHQLEAGLTNAGAAEEAMAIALPLISQCMRLRAELLNVSTERDDSEQRFQAISNSTIWRLTAPLRRLIERLSKLQANSRQLQPLPSAVQPIVEPLQPRELSALKDAYRRNCARELDAFLATVGRLSFPVAVKPRVSILIVLFNQAELTLNCLRSLAREASSRVEIIIVDNNSTDRTGELLDRLDGVRVIRSAENLHFLYGVNRAAQDARGTHLLLLNNDTIVESGAIDAAAARLDAEPNLGAVGGPIVLLDGTLQEAGSIIWSNGHCQGYGYGRDPAEWEFQFRRDVDYCSGAFLMVRRDLFNWLAGFDTAYAPAYYEETDLCMRIRASGFRVAYEPAARIVHFGYGSASSSRDAAELYARNRKRFVARHATALAASHYTPTTSLLRARMRNGMAGHVLIINSYALVTCAKSSISTVRRLINELLKNDFSVTYCVLNNDSTDYSIFESIIPDGVEISIFSQLTNVEEFIRQRGDYYEIAMLLDGEYGDLSVEAKRLLKVALAGLTLVEIPLRYGVSDMS